MAPSDDRSGQLGEAMKAYQNGRVEAFDLLYRHLLQPLRAYLISRCLNRALAEDLLQETFLQIHRSRHTYQPDRPVIPWAFGVARNVWLMHERARRKEREDYVDEEVLLQLEADSRLETLADRITLAKALAGLTADQREVLLLHFDWGFTFREIGQLLGVQPVTAKLRAFRARRVLQKRISSVTDRAAEAK